MKKTLSFPHILITAFAVLLFSCAPPFSNHYYYQQQFNRDQKSGDNTGGPDTDWGGDEDPGKEPENPQKPGSISVFSVILPDGAVNEELLSDNPEILSEIKSRMPAENGRSSSDYENLLIRSRFTSDNVPVLWFEQGEWTAGDAARGEYTNNGPNTTAGSNGISTVVYYAYRSLNPFYGPDSSYNTAGFDKESSETRIERFNFYRFTGKPIPSLKLDNMLVAVDTYTNLVFCFGKPTEFKSVVGNKVPIEWGPVDSVCSGPDGKKYKFYEYDPAGYINTEGEFIAEDWYKSNMAAGNYDPVYTGKSPYTVQITAPPKVEAVLSATSVENGILRDGNGFYTEIKCEANAVDLIYKLYRKDNRSEEWIQLGGNINVKAGEQMLFRDYDALIISGYPGYKTELYTLNEDLLKTSEPVEGSRALTDRELLIAAMDTIRLSFDDLWYTVGNTKLKYNSVDGIEGTFHTGIKRSWLLGTDYYRFMKYDNYKRHTVSINGSFMLDNGYGAAYGDKRGTWTHSGSEWPDEKIFSPQTNSLTIVFKYQVFKLKFNNIITTDGIFEDPEWTQGSFIIESEQGRSEYGKEDVPFCFFTDFNAILNGIDAENYRQK